MEVKIVKPSVFYLLLNKIFNKELTATSFILRVMACVFSVLLFLPSFAVFLFSDFFKNYALSPFFSFISFLWSSISHFYTWFLNDISILLSSIYNLLIYIDAPYFYQNKLLLSFFVLGSLTLMISYRFVNFQKNGYKPYYRKLYIFLTTIEFISINLLLYILASESGTLLQQDSNSMYTVALSTVFFICFFSYPFIIFTIFNKESSMAFINYKIFLKKLKDNIDQASELFFSGAIMSFLLLIFSLLVIDPESPLSVFFTYFSLILSISVSFLIIITSNSEEAIEFQVKDSTNPHNLLQIRSYKGLVEVCQNQENKKEIFDKLNITSEKDFYSLYVKDFYDSGARKHHHFEVKTVWDISFQHRSLILEFYDLNFKKIK